MVALTSHRRWRSDRGAELIEFAVILPLLLVLFGAIIDFGFLFKSYTVVHNAAREAARIRVLPGYANPDAIARANSYLTAAGLTAVHPNPTVTTQNLGSGATAFRTHTVTVTYPHSFTVLGPFLSLIGGGIGDITISATAVMRAEM